MNRMFNFFFCLLFSNVFIAQKSNLYLFEYEMEEDSIFFDAAYFLNGFNQSGYNGDPEFLGDNQILAVVNVNPETPKTAEIVLMDIEDKAFEIITNNNKQDSNPSKIVANRFSAIETNNQGDKTLNIYTIGSEKVEKAFVHLDNIENAKWLDHDNAVLNLKSDLYYLAFGIKSEDSFKITEANVDKEIVHLNGPVIHYVHKLKHNVWYLKEYDTSLKKKKTVIQMPNKVDVFTILNDGSFICASGSELLRYHPADQKKWIKLEDLWQFGIREIVDLKVRNNKLLVVSAY